LAEIIQATESVPVQLEPAPLPKETTDMGQFMRFVASTNAKLPPEERTFVRFLIAPQGYSVGDERQDDRRDIQKTSTSWRSPT